MSFPAHDRSAEPVPASGEPGVDRFAHFVVRRLEDGQLDCIGRGAMGVTYRAHDTQLDRLVALKVISPQWVDDAEVRSRFGREARAAARLQHPNIAGVLYQGVEGAACFYAMELVVGETLEGYIKRLGSLAPVYALRIAHQIALALGAAGRQGVLHRDLKPGNVMLTSYDDTGEPHAKVIDFGLAKVLSEVSSSYSQGGFLGTPEFASPEQCADEPLDIRSDLYSLGATLWFMLAGRPPYTGSMLAVIQAQAAKPLPIEELGEIPAPLQSVLLRLLAKLPAERPSTPAEAAREIEVAIAQLSAANENFTPLTVAPAKAVTRSPSRFGSQVVREVVPEKRWSPLVIGAIGLAVVATAAAFYFAGKSHAPLRNPSAAVPAPAVLPDKPDRPEPPPALAPPPPSQGKGKAPVVNSLGMQLLPVPNVPGRISATETRVRDFAAFVTAANYRDADRGDLNGHSWRQPGFAQEDDHPVVYVNVQDALAFCDWLTRTERAAGRIAAHQAYHLPSRPEWDATTGFRPPPRGEGPPPDDMRPGGGPRPREMGPPPGERPRRDEGMRSGERPPPAPGEGPRFGEDRRPGVGASLGEDRRPGVGPALGDDRRPEPSGPPSGGTPGPPFLWGTHRWPPSPGAGNFADQSIPDYQDGFARTAPVGRFSTGQLGFFDLAGNVWEIVLDGDPAAPQVMILGGSWQISAQTDLRMHTATPSTAVQRKPDMGFRILLTD